MKIVSCVLLAAISICFLTGCMEYSDRSNFLIIMSDDVSPEQQSSLYGANFVSSPGFDSIAQNGLLFNYAYASTSSCAPARASLLTLRNIWQNEEAACHLSIFPNTFPTYVELLKDNGYYCGIYRKMWKPGIDLRDYTAGKLINRGNRDMDVVDAIGSFLNKNYRKKPFHFVINTFDGHAPFDKDKWELYKDRLDTMKVPDYLPNNNSIKKRLLNANYEIERFDEKVGRIIAYLNEIDLLENTVIIVTSDNGTTISGNGKGLGAYEVGCKVPLAIQWLKGIKEKGRVIDDLVTQIDVSKTILDIANIEPAISMTEGKSLMNIFESSKAGYIDDLRSEVYLGFERHIINRSQKNSCYPVRSIRTKDYLYVLNFKPGRHIWGPKNNHRFNKKNGEPQWQYTMHNGNKTDLYYKAFTQKRPKEELFDMRNDAACLNNLANSGEHQKIKAKLKNKLKAKLKQDNDPRMFNNGHWFDMAPFPDNMMQFAKTDGCKAYDENYESPFDRTIYPTEIQDRNWR